MTTRRPSPRLQTSSDDVGERVELGRYRTAAGGDACSTASASRRWCASPTSRSTGPGRAYLVERGLEEDGYAALLALVADYLEIASQLGVPPMSTTSSDSERKG